MQDIMHIIIVLSMPTLLYTYINYVQYRFETVETLNYCCNV